MHTSTDRSPSNNTPFFTFLDDRQQTQLISRAYTYEAAPALRKLTLQFNRVCQVLHNPTFFIMDKLPLHRRASWGKNQQSYDTYMRNDMAKSRSPTSSQDYGIGNFSYDDKHLVDW